MTLAQRKIKSPLGPLFLVASPKAIKGIYFDKQNLPTHTGDTSTRHLLDLLEQQLKEYFAGDRTSFDLPLDPDGTEFQKKVWKQLLKIPYGQTQSYKDIAKGIKDANASRAVGTANSKNPICIIIPCHRVITSNATLGGYTGGLDKKIKLLNIEHIDTTRL